MAKIRVTKEFDFEIAHALWNYDGPCANIHGHSYRLFVTVIGEPINDNKNPKQNQETKEDALNRSMDITLSKIIKTNTPEFKINYSKLIWEIRIDKNLDSKYKNLQILYKNDQTHDTEKFGTKTKLSIEKEKKELITEEKVIKIRMQLIEEVENNEITKVEADKKWELIQKQLIEEWKSEKNTKELQTEKWEINYSENDVISSHKED